MGDKRTWVDFLGRRPGSPPALVQVCADLSAPETRQRELRALREAMVEQGQDHGVIVTLDETDRLVTEHGEVSMVPAWRWLLEERSTAVR